MAPWSCFGKRDSYQVIPASSSTGIMWIDFPEISRSECVTWLALNLICYYEVPTPDVVFGSDLLHGMDKPYHDQHYLERESLSSHISRCFKFFLLTSPGISSQNPISWCPVLLNHSGRDRVLLHGSTASQRHQSVSRINIFITGKREVKIYERGKKPTYSTPTVT